MKRKLIKQGGGGLTLYLPKKWIDARGLNGGDEVDITEDKDKLILAPEGIKKEEKKIEVDITDMDRSSLNYLIKSLYESGYDEIKFNFYKKETMDYKVNKKVLFSDVITKCISNFEGYAIISQGKNFYLIKDIGKQSENEFDNIFRRIFFLIAEFNKIIKEGIESKDHSELKMAYEIHDNIAKFIEFCIRLLNKSTITEAKKYNIYHILLSLDLIVDYNRYLCKDIIAAKKTNKEANEFIYRTFEIFDLFHIYFYTPTNKNMQLIIKNRFSLKKDILSSKLSYKEKDIIDRYSAVFEVINSLLKCVLAIRESN